MSKLAKSTMKKTPFDQSSFGMGFVQGSGIHADAERQAEVASARYEPGSPRVPTPCTPAE